MRQIAFLLLFWLGSYLHADRPPLHIITVGNYQHIGLERLLYSAHQSGLHVNVMGLGKPYPHHFVKFSNMLKFLDGISGKDLVMFVDAFDVILLGGEEEIVTKFLSYEKPCVFAAEQHYHPKNSAFDLIGEYPESPTRLRYLNSGTYIGYAFYIKKMLEETIARRFRMPVARMFKRLHDDQYHLHRYFARHQNEIALDRHALIFLPLSYIGEQEIEIDRETKRVRYKLSGNSPPVIHGCGTGLPLMVRLFNEFFPNIITGASE